MKILGIGESVIDNVYRIDPDLIGVDGKFIPNGMRSSKHVGGPVLIAMILLARLGIECTYVTSVGRDADAQLINQLLKHEKVRLIPKYQHKTKVNTILVNKQTGQREKIRGPVKHASIKNLERNFLHQFDLILIDRHEQQAFYEIVKKKKTKTKIVIDPSTEISKFTLDMIRYADYPIIPIEAILPTNAPGNLDDAIRKLHTWCKKPLIITAGDGGSIVYDGTNLEMLPPLRIEAIDTTGAGDIYRGAFAYGVMQGWNLIKSAQFANVVSGLQCTRKGNAAAIPTKKEINDSYLSFLSNRSNSQKNLAIRI